MDILTPPPSQLTKKYNEELEKLWLHLSTVGKQTPGVSTAKSPLDNPPQWFNLERFTRAQKLTKRYYFSLNIAHFIGNILLVLLPRVTIPIFASGRSSTVYMVFLRILSTINHVDSWYQDNPFEKGSKANKSLAKVRRSCHLQVSKLMNEKYPLENDRWLSQFDMTMTQWSLIGLVAIRPKQCGFYATTKEEFEEFIYFWRVIGHCMGIEDQFNCCLDNYEQSLQFMEICFDRGYKPYLDHPNSIVQSAMQLTEGVFLGLNISIPKFILSYEGLMKYWYETLNIPHQIKLDTWSAAISYKLQIFLVDYLLKVTVFYRLASFIYFQTLSRLFKTVNQVKNRMDLKYKDIVYRIPTENGIYSINNPMYTPNIPQLANLGVTAT